MESIALHIIGFAFIALMLMGIWEGINENI